MTQEQATEILKMGKSVFLTGEPGSGKTYTVNQFVSWLRGHGINPAITASTGVAATHINGQTIHSWSGIGIKSDITRKDVVRIKNNKRTAKRICGAHTLVIDEISMLSGQTFSAVDAVCRGVRDDARPFGGLQVVMVGDFFQLPPVRREEGFVFESESWEELKPTICYLTEQHRQKDPEFLGLLSAIRRGDVQDEHREILQSRYFPHAQENVIQFYSRNKNVDAINEAKLARLPASMHAFTMSSWGSKNVVEALIKSCLSPQTLQLKIGARVMFTKNDLNHRYVNGTFGTLVEFSPQDGAPVVRTDSGHLIDCEMAEWAVEDDGKVVAKVLQYPLRLAWAITAHKSQGMSLDAAHMDLSDTFEYGQGYVAISRVRTLEGLYLAGINNRALEMHPEILTKDSAFRHASEQVEERLQEIPPEQIRTIQEKFSKDSGGVMAHDVKTASAPVANMITPRRKYSYRGQRQQETLEEVRKTGSVQAAAEKLGFSSSTIFKHLEDLREQKLAKPEDFIFLSVGKEKMIDEIQQVISRMGGERLRPIYDELGERVSFDDIRLARLLF